jgi:enamine deaminase RidA (YjgF/YER057c/UK114 family)
MWYKEPPRAFTGPAGRDPDKSPYDRYGENGSSMDHIVKTVIYLKRMEDSQAMRDTELEYYRKHARGLVGELPAGTLVQVLSLSRSGRLAKIDVSAVRA